MPKDIISLADWSPQELRGMLARAQELVLEIQKKETEKMKKIESKKRRNMRKKKEKKNNKEEENKK